MKFCADKHIDQRLQEVAREPGWRVERTNGGHLKITSPAGECVFMSGTPSDWRVYEKLRMKLRRLGAPENLTSN